MDCGSWCPEGRRVTEAVDVARLGHQPVAVPTGVGHDRDRGARAAADARTRPGEVGVAEGEDPAVGSHHEVAALVVARHHADDRCVEAVGLARSGRVEPETRDRAVELGVAEAEDPAVGGVEPVATAVFGRHDADHGALQGNPAHRAVELGRAEGEDPAVRSHQPVAVGEG